MSTSIRIIVFELKEEYVAENILMTMSGKNWPETEVGVSEKLTNEDFTRIWGSVVTHCNFKC